MYPSDNFFSPVKDAVWLLDIQSRRVIYANEQFENIRENLLEEIKSDPQKWAELIHPDDLNYYRAEHERLLQVDNLELNYRIAVIGGIKWIKEKAFRINPENGPRGFLLSIFSDISRERPADQKPDNAENTFKNLFQKHPNPLWIFDRSTLKFLDVNESAIQSYGYSRDEYLDMDLSAICPEKELNELKEVLKSDQENFRSSKFWPHKKKDGSTIWVDTTLQRIHYKDRQAELLIALDVMDRIKADEELVRREKLLSSLVESHSNFMMRLDATGHFTFVNQPFVQQVKYPARELLGSHFHKVTLPEDYELCDRKLKECLNNPGRVISLTHHKVDAEGRLFLTSWEFIAISNRENKIAEIQGVGRDITAEVKNREDLETKERNLDALINNTRDLIWSIDQKQHMLSANKAYLESIHKFTGQFPQIGEPIFIEHYSPGDAQKWKGYYRKALKGKRYSIIEFLATEQGIKKAEISFNPIRNAEGEVLGVGCFARDLTQRINYEDQILAQNSNLREIASIASHEIRGPVASMMGLFNLLDRPKVEGEHNQKIMQFMEQSLHQLDSVIHKIVEISYRLDPEGIADSLKDFVPRNQSGNG